MSEPRKACIFYKLIVHSILQDNKLRIPSKFVRKYGDELSAVATLVVDKSREWLVEVKTSGRTRWFCDGWLEFLQNHCIHVGHLLVFQYEGNSSFNVYVFNLTDNRNHKCTSCSNSSPMGSTSLSLRNEDLDETKWKNSMLRLDEENNLIPTKGDDNLKVKRSTKDIGVQFSGCGLGMIMEKIEFVLENEVRERDNKRKFKVKDESIHVDANEQSVNPKAKTPSTKIIRGLTNVSIEEKERVSKAADDLKPPNPYCKVTMRQSYVNKGYLLHIPSGFAQYLDGVAKFITLEDGNGKKWPVRLIFEDGDGNKGRKAKLSKGWFEFVLGNDLKEGDVCVFELVKVNDTVLKVTIFRVCENSEPASAPLM